MVVVLHLPSNFYVFIYHEILSYSIFAHGPVCAPVWVITTKPSTVESKELWSKEVGGGKEEEEKKEKEREREKQQKWRGRAPRHKGITRSCWTEL